MGFTQLLFATLVLVAVVVGDTHIVLPTDFVDKNSKLNPGDELYFLPGSYKCDEFTIHDNVTYKAAALAYIYCNFVSVPFLNSTVITGFHFITTGIYINVNQTAALPPSDIVIYDNIFWDSTLHVNGNGATVQYNVFENSYTLRSVVSQQCANCIISYNNFIGVGGNVIHMENSLNAGKTVIEYNCIFNTSQTDDTLTHTAIEVSSSRSDVLLQVSDNVLYELANGYAISITFGGNAVVHANFITGGSNNGSALLFNTYAETASTAFLMVTNNTIGGSYSTDLIACTNIQVGDVMDNTFYQTVTVDCPNILTSNNTDGGSNIPQPPSCPFLP